MVAQVVVAQARAPARALERVVAQAGPAQAPGPVVPEERVRRVLAPPVQERVVPQRQVLRRWAV